MGFLFIVTALAFSADGAAWGDYVKPKPATPRSDGGFPYYDIGFGCHKGYEERTDSEGKINCTQCSKLPKDYQGCSTDDDPWKDEKEDIHCNCKKKKWVAGSCPAWAKGRDAYFKLNETTKAEKKISTEGYKKHKKFAAYADKQCMFHGCMPYGSKARCSGLAVWAFILIVVLAVVVVVAIVVVVIIVILKLRGGKPTTKVDPAPTEAKSAAPVAEAPPEVVGPSVLIKLGKQEIRTKKAADGPTAVWGEAVVFTGVGAEDDDVTIEVNGNSGDLLGSAELRIPEYVNNKKRAVLTLKNGEADAGVLEIDIEIQVQEEPEVKITGVFFVDKYTK